MADDSGAEDLEDGELWLPSDFFSMDEVQVSSEITSPFGLCSSSKPHCMDGFHRVSASTFLPRHPHNRGLCKPLQTLQRFKPAIWYGLSGVSGCGGHNPCDCGTGKSWIGCSPIYQLQRLSPVQDRAEETFMGERALPLQRQQQNRLVLNRISPRLGMGSHEGTGVFLPRVSSNTVSKKHNPHSVGKGPRTNSLHEFQLPPRKILLNKRQEDYRVYAAAEVRMPNNNWNY